MRTPPQRTLGRGFLMVLPLLGACADEPTTPDLPVPAGLRMTSSAESFFANSQSAQPGSVLAVAPAVVVEDESGRPLPGVTVRFIVSAGGGTVQDAITLTDRAGVASSGPWKLGNQAGPNEVTAVVGSLSPVHFRAAGDPPSFRITVRFLNSAPPHYQEVVANAVRRWESIIERDLEDYLVNSPAGSCFMSQPALDETVDDLLLLVDLVSLDGPGGYLGEGGPCYLRSSSLLPAMGYLRLDLDDLAQIETQGLLPDLVLHEVGHVIGVGTLWRAKSLLAGSGGSDPRVGGQHALEAYRTLGGSDAAVPAENSGGFWTRDVHWRESVFGDELMTGYIGAGPNPLSALTVGTLRDLGYGTNAEGASAYVMSGTQARKTFDLHEREQVVLPKFISDARGGVSAVLR